MTPGAYSDKIKRVQSARATHNAIVLAPRVVEMPLEIARFDDPFLPYGKAVIAATRDLVCAYVFDLAAYLAIGAAGAVALERTIAYVRGDGQTITVLHAPFASGDFAAAAGDGAFAVDAVTVTPGTDSAPFVSAGVAAYNLTNGALPSVLRIDDGDESLDIRLIEAEIVRAARGDDYLDVIRAAIERRREA
ncbi:MAG: hypothetical protein SGJ24_14900 [Chloroflexota bacterium]|nr:hypothetical protein [Chloroflexota bacterium]